MTLTQSIYHTYQRYRTLQTDHVKALPVVILMPHSSCNCRCVMCDIWKDNKNLKQLSEKDISGLLGSLKKLGTRRVVLSGGEALLHPNFFRLCELLKKLPLKITLLSTGLTVKKHAGQIVRHVDDLIVSLDGDKEIHNQIRNIPNAFDLLKEGIISIKQICASFKITARTVIHKINFRIWPGILQAAKEIAVDQISFLPADISSHAFNREVLWSEKKQEEIRIEEFELSELKQVIDHIISQNSEDFLNGFIAEGPEKLKKIYHYYAAFYGFSPFPEKKCNAPWVSAVVEADGSVRPCFFHNKIGNINESSLDEVLNSNEAIQFRKKLDIIKNETCVKCVCYLHLSPGANPGK